MILNPFAVRGVNKNVCRADDIKSVCRMVENLAIRKTPQRGRSTKPRASERRERRPGWNGIPDGALKGQKRYDGQCGLGLLPFQGATSAGMGTQGVAHLRSLALGLELDGLSDRCRAGRNLNRLPCGA